VMLSELDRGILSPSRYLDRCAYCGKREADHKKGRCGKYQWVFVEQGTSFKNEFEQRSK
jgi:hypothetical protein